MFKVHGDDMRVLNGYKFIGVKTPGISNEAFYAMTGILRTYSGFYAKSRNPNKRWYLPEDAVKEAYAAVEEMMKKDHPMIYVRLLADKGEVDAPTLHDTAVEDKVTDWIDSLNEAVVG